VGREYDANGADLGVRYLSTGSGHRMSFWIRRKQKRSHGQLYVARKGLLWIGTDSGRHSIGFATAEQEPYGIAEGLSGKIGGFVYEDRELAISGWGGRHGDR